MHLDIPSSCYCHTSVSLLRSTQAQARNEARTTAEALTRQRHWDLSSLSAAYSLVPRCTPSHKL